MSFLIDEQSVRHLDTVQIQARGVIRLLSKKIAQAVDLKEGDFLRVSVDGDGRMILEPLDLIPRSERYLHTPAWKTRLREAERDVLDGRTEQVVSSGDLLDQISRAADELED